MTATRRDGLGLALILAVAAVLRLPGLPGRGEWDDDQGDQLLTMLHWVRDGQIPDLGPMGSLGTAHHGVAYYWLLAPGAFLTDANPVAAVATLAIVGMAGVAATWWLGRIVGGPLAGHLAGLLMAVSASAITASTFVWNSNIVGPAIALAVAAGWQAWRTRHARWWIFAAVGMALAMQGHLSSLLAAPPLIGMALADVARRPGGQRRHVLMPLLGAAAVVVISYLPLLAHELRHDFSEIRAIVDFVVSGRGRSLPTPAGSSLAALPVIAWRVLASPLSGFVLSAPLAGFAALFTVSVAVAVAALGTSCIARQYGRWSVATIVWAVAALSVISPSLGIMTPGLPTDQYHAWLDPILLAAVGVATAHLWSTAVTVGRFACVAIIASCLALALLAMPPLTSPGGGWPAAAAAADRIRVHVGGQPVAITGVAKAGTSLAFPLQRAGANVVTPSSADYLVVVCDPLFERAVGLPCGGPAETAAAHQSGLSVARLVDRFANSPRLVVCVFARE